MFFLAEIVPFAKAGNAQNLALDSPSEMGIRRAIA